MPKMPPKSRTSAEIQADAEARAATAARAQAATLKGKTKQAAPKPSEQIADHIGAMIDGQQTPAATQTDLEVERQIVNDERAAELTEQSNQVLDEMREAAQDGTLGEVLDAMIAKDNERAAADVPELTYSDDGSQALPDDPAISPDFTPVVPPPAKKGKGKGKGGRTVWSDYDVESDASKAKKGKKNAPAANETPLPNGHTVERDTSETLPATIADPARAIVDNKNFKVTALGLQVVGKPTFEEWASWKNSTGVVRNGLDWADYDHMVFGEEAYGENAAQWIAKNGGSAQTYWNKKSALKRYAVSERVFGVSLSAHIEAAKLEPMIRNMVLLEMQTGIAADGKPMETISDLRRRMKQIADSAKPDADDKGGSGNDGDGDDDSDDDTEREIDWEETPVGEYLYAHAGEGMLEAVLDKNGNLPASLKKAMKDKRFKGDLKVVIYLAKQK